METLSDIRKVPLELIQALAFLFLYQLIDSNVKRPLHSHSETS